MSALQKGDHVAILSPSSTIAGEYRWVFEQGIERLKSVFSLNPIIMPHCLNIQATQQDRADDLQAAFADPKIKAVFSTTGGIDQIQLINLLDPSVFQKKPKPFFGYSDNTHLCNFLYANGVKSFYGASVLSQLAMQGEMCQETIDSLNWALFHPTKWFDLRSPAYCVDEDYPWEDPEYLKIPRVREANVEGHIFDGTKQAEGTLWGGCLESLADLLRVRARAPEDYSRLVLFLETSEEIPSHEFVRRFMVSLGEAGVLSAVQGLLVGRPKTWFFDKKLQLAEKKDYQQKQRNTILSVVRSYNSNIPIVFNVSIGHVDPQLILPYGGKIQIYPRDGVKVIA